MKLFTISFCSLPLLHLQLVLMVPFYWQLMQVNSLGNETDRLSLIQFKERITGDPHGILSSWNDSTPFCSWFGVTCSYRHQRVTSLILEGQKLSGSISPCIGNLTFLRHINLRNNSFSGAIPQKVGKLFRLQQIYLNNNTLEGEIPVNLTSCSQLGTIDFGWNNFGGKIPAELGTLAKLQILALPANNLTGKIPPSLGNLSSLQHFSVTENYLVGDIPGAVCKLEHLKFLAVAVNSLSGVIPPSLFNISSIVILSATQNQLNGSLPDNIGLTLPNLHHLSLGLNKLSGTIPSSLANASRLQVFDITENNFLGPVPSNLGDLPNLWFLNLGENNLGSNSSNDLAFLKSLANCTNLKILAIDSNLFGGALPDPFPKFSSQLIKLFTGNNQIVGIIPPAFENLTNLYALSMDNNFLRGMIPSYLGKFQKLQLLSLFGNRFSGQLPSSIGNLTQLSVLYISQNNLEGTIPSSIGNCQHLFVLDLEYNNLTGAIPEEILNLPSLSMYLTFSHNSLTGGLPEEVGKLTALNTLYISENILSGEIPTTIGDCLSLEDLEMQRNFFQGTIPDSMASMKSLKYLDLSQNNLTGEIPKTMQNLTSLLYLNISFNDLEGEVPTGGVFGNASAIYLIGNSRLCGGIPELHLPECPTKVPKKGKPTAIKLTILITSVVLGTVMTILIVLLWKRKSKSESSSSTFGVDHLIKVSYRSLHETTGGFSSKNLLGSGSLGIVYKGFLDQVERPIAVKVLNLQVKGASKSFLAECNALRNTRHRNLVKLITYCSSLDYKGNDFKALVFEYMTNGSLEKWLHPDPGSENQPRNLDILQRLNIAIDVASALHYLHDLCEVPIIHCDLKPSNVLLDDDMVAHLSDFGLAKLLSTFHDLSQSKISTGGIRGTFGYAAPEYGLGATVSKEGDVYSYGILVLEMFSGRRPTDEMFKDGLNLSDFVKAALPTRLMQVVDPTLYARDSEEVKVVARSPAREEEQEEGGDEDIEEADNGTIIHGKMRPHEQNSLLSILEIGVSCLEESPKERVNMASVLRKLHLVKDAFLGVQLQGGRPHATYARPLI